MVESGVYGSDLHLGGLERVVVAGPRSPIDAVGVRRVWSGEVLAVEVGRVTALVPPRTLVHLRARRTVGVVVLVVRAEVLAAVT